MLYFLKLIHAGISTRTNSICIYHIHTVKTSLCLRPGFEFESVLNTKMAAAVLLVLVTIGHLCPELHLKDLYSFNA